MPNTHAVLDASKKECLHAAPDASAEMGFLLPSSLDDALGRVEDAAGPALAQPAQSPGMLPSSGTT